MLLILIFSLFTGISANVMLPVKSHSVSQTDSIHFKTINFTRTPDDCINCNIRVRLSYPEITQAKTVALRDSMNQQIMNFILGSVYTGKKVDTPQKIYQDMVQEYDTLLKKFPDYPRHLWYLDRKVTIIHHTPAYTSLEMNENVFTGGAHPLSTRLYEVFDNHDGHQLKLGDVIQPHIQDSLLSISEKIFRKTRSLSPYTSLNDAGFWFDNNQFSLNDNFAFSEKGLIFYYNPYEIAPYAWGPTKLLIPWEKLRGLLKSRYAR